MITTCFCSWALWLEIYRITWLNVNLFCQSRKLRKNRGVPLPFLFFPLLPPSDGNQDPTKKTGWAFQDYFDGGGCHPPAFLGRRFCFSAITFYSEIIIETTGPRLSPPPERATQTDELCTGMAFFILGMAKKNLFAAVGTRPNLCFAFPCNVCSHILVLKCKNERVTRI